jgi:predicted transposase/invertase (TIGR01784 family)
MKQQRVRNSFIAALLDIPLSQIQETTLLPTIQDPLYADGKLSILDVLVQIQDGRRLNLEMQVAPFAYWNERKSYYLSKMFVDQIHSGETYGDLRKCIHVSILDHTLYKEDDRCYRSWMFCDIDTKKVVSDLFEFKIIELRKPVQEGSVSKKLSDWIQFFSGTRKEDFEMIASRNEAVKEAYDTLVNLSNDPEARMRYEFELKAIRDYHAGMEYAEQKGVQQGLQRERSNGLEVLIATCQSFGASENQIIERLVSSYGLSYEEAREQLKCIEEKENPSL